MFPSFLFTILALTNSVEVLSTKIGVLMRKYQSPGTVHKIQKFPLQSVQIVLTISTYEEVQAPYIKNRATYESLRPAHEESAFIRWYFKSFWW